MQEDGQEELRRQILKYEGLIEEEKRRLREEQEKRAKDKAFAENAFYTSNEEGMGVSPNMFNDQN